MNKGVFTKPVLLFVIFIGFIKFNVCAQDTLNPGNIEIRASYGYILRHHLDMGLYTTHHFPCFEANYYLPATKNKHLHQYNGNPELGLAYWYSQLGQTSILGDVHAVLLWNRMPLFKKKKSSLTIRLGCGIAYFQKKFDRYNNYKNLAIGSHFNANLQLLFEYRINLSKNTALATSIGLAHFSNGAMATPNYGINVPHAGLLFAWGNKQKSQSNTNLKLIPFQKHWNSILSLSNGFKQIMPVLGKEYMIFTASADWIYCYSGISGIGAGVDVFWDGSDREVLKRLKNELSDDPGLVKPGIKAIKQWNMGRMDFNFELGFYLYQKEKSDGSVYDKVSLQYYFTDKIIAVMSLKTHYARADYFSWGIGYKMK